MDVLRTPVFLDAVAQDSNCFKVTAHSTRVDSRQTTVLGILSAYRSQMCFIGTTLCFYCIIYLCVLSI